MMWGTDGYKSQFLPDPNWLEYSFMIVSKLPQEEDIDPPFILNGRLIESASIKDLPPPYNR
jgi:hypothetical protein